MNKLIFFTSRYPFRTVSESFFEGELAAAAKAFDEVYVITCNGRGKNLEILKDLPENVRAMALERDSFKTDLILGLPQFPFRAFFWRELFNLIKKKHPLVKSLKSLVYSGCFYLAILRKFKKIKAFLEINEDDNVVLMGYWLSYISAALLKFKKYMGLKNSKVLCRAHGSADVFNFANPRQYFVFQDYLLKNLDGIFAVSKKGADFLKSKSPCPEKIKMQYIGSDGADEFIKRSRAPFTVMTCSNLFAAKRVNLVAEAMQTLVKEIPDIKWVHFGDGPKRQELEALCADIKDAVTFKGYTPHGEVIDYLSSGEASLFISPSASEGLPISVGEAHGFSLPTIATDVGSTCEIQISGTTGDLMGADLTAEDIISLVLKYYNMSDEEYDAICKSTHKFWQENFNSKTNGALLAQDLLTF